jgi:hypothetical protein
MIISRSSGAAERRGLDGQVFSSRLCTQELSYI